jgi:hypothetical protein
MHERERQRGGDDDPAAHVRSAPGGSKARQSPIDRIAYLLYP